MGARDALQLLRGLGQGDVEPRLAALAARHQELEAGRRLARPGVSLDQVQAILREASGKNVVEAGDARARALGNVGSGLSHAFRASHGDRCRGDAGPYLSSRTCMRRMGVVL